MSRKRKCPDPTATDPGEVSLEETPENRNHYSRKQPKRQAGRCQKLDEQPVRRPAYWAVLPAEVRYDPELPDKAKLLYAEISSLTSERGYCYANNEYFLRLYGMTDRTLQRNLKALQDGGFIRILDGDGGHGRRKIFAGINPLSQNPDKNDGVTPTKLSGGPDKIVGDIKKVNQKRDQNTPKPPKGAESASGGSSSGLTAGEKENKGAKSVPEYRPEIFERFWTLYPIHKSRQSAVKAWDRLKPSGELMRPISKALKRQMATDEQWTRGIGIPYAATYLNQRRWEDDILPDRSAAGADQGAGSEEAELWI